MMSNTRIPKVPKFAIQGPGLKREGIVILQFLAIFSVTLVESWLRGGVGVFTGLVICAAVYGGIRFGRNGTIYVSVVTPPLAFAASALISVSLLDGFKLSRVGIDFIASLASQAPFLLISALYGWFIYFNRKAKSRPARRKI